MEHDSKTDLMDDLMQHSGCLYLSDLHSPQYAANVREALQEIDAEQYSVRAWNDAAQYISGSKEPLETPAQALAFLRNWLSEETLEDTPPADA